MDIEMKKIILFANPVITHGFYKLLLYILNSLICNEEGCLTCNNNFYLSTSTCYLCNETLIFCSECLNNEICTKCEDLYVLSNNECKCNDGNFS